MIEVCQSKKTSYSSDHFRHRPFFNGFYLGIIHLDPLSRDYHAKEFHLLDAESAFLQFRKNVMLFQSFQDLLYNPFMLLDVVHLGIDHEVINVDHHDVIHV